MKVAYINGIILNGSEDMRPQKGMMILTDGEKIESVVPQTAKAPGGYQQVDLNGRYIMPGLINMHLHLPASGRPKKKEEDNVKKVRLLTGNALFRRIVRSMCERYAKTQLMSGVTTIRTMGGVLDVDSQIRDRIDQGKITGPRILAADMAVSVEGGHMVHSLAYAAHSEDEARSLVRKILKGRPDVIKLMITGGVLDAKAKGEPGELKMPAEYVKAASGVSEVAQYNGKIVFDGIIECARTCLENGIPVGLGTDTGCPYITHYDMWRELNYYHKYCGVSRAFALYTATKLNARLAGIGDVTGSIEEGKCADFVVTRENPLEDLQALRNIDMVVARGHIIRHPKVKKMPEVERQLDKFL